MLADLLVDRDQFSAQLLEAMVFIDFGLRLAPSRGRRKRFGNGLSVHFPCEANLRIVSWVCGLCAMASRFSATARNSADRTWTQIAEAGEVTQYLGSLGFQLRQ